ncbi:MAG: CHAT domain-containing protein, partial [Planctomycetes bacterium]|nr:CHAT domain-containing protein [Planctomycetota bacterium]
RQLMTAFYQKLWAGGSDVTPARALREAQLELYRQAKSGRGPVRGPVPIAEAFPPPALPAPAPGSRFDADTFLWAAFVASGAP